jgi:polyketide cyclase/dehydrase/lipid transport protein
MSVTIRQFDIPSSELFAVLLDPVTYPKWLVGARKIRSVDAEWPRVGARFQHVVGFGPVVIADHTTVTQVEFGRVLELDVRARPGMRARVRFNIDPSPDGCRLTMTEEPIGVFRLIAPFTEPLLRARNRKSLQRLADLVEEGVYDRAR